MDDPGRQVIMGPPAAVATASNQPGPGNPSSAPPPQVTKGAPPPKRIIKKVQLDFNKLKEAGLDRQLAEVLRNQKLGDRKVETPSSSIPSPSAAAQSTSNAAECKLHQPQQQFRQPAPQPLVKRFMISEFIEKTVPIQTTPNPTVYNTSNANRSMHVKTLLKNRILNKNTTINSQPQQMATTSQAASLSSAQGSASRGAASPAAFSMPIAKADLTIRPKQQPLLLNLVNQLPKHRAMCGPSYKSLMKQQHTPGQQISPNPQRIAAQQPIQISTQLQPQHPFQPAPEVPVDQSVSVVSPRLHKSPSPPLIVLENKVLAPNEKIDLSGLRLPNAPVPTTLSQAKPSETPVQTNLQSKIIKGKVIMNANKFKVSREKLAEMAKEIRQQANQVKLPATPEPASSTTERPFTITSILQRNKTPLFTPATLEENNVPLSNPILKANSLPACTKSRPISNPFPVDNSTNLESGKTKEYTGEEVAEPSPLELPLYIPSTLEVKLLPQTVPKASNTLHLSEHTPATPEPKEYCKKATTKPSPPKHSGYISSTSEREGGLQEPNPLDFPVYIPSHAQLTQLPGTMTTESCSDLPVHIPATEEVNAESSRPAYNPLPPEKISLLEGVTTASKAADLCKPEVYHAEVTKEPRFIDLPVCIPSSCETTEFSRKEAANPTQNDLTSKLNEFSEKSSSESSCLASTEIKSPVKKVQTAVDFIAQLAAENPLDESAFMDLSPEEQRLNALFGGGEYMGMSPVNEPAQPEEELPIGKIVQMDNMNILHATLDVHSDSTNVLRISPNALRLQSSGSILEKSLVDIEGVTDSVVEEKKEQVNLPEPPAEVATKPSVVKSLVFDTLETPNQEPQEDARSTVINTNNLKNDPNPKLNESEVPLEEIKPVSDAELVQEVNPPVKRSTIRSKKAKINLVQRTKRPSIPKAIEAKKTKIDFEEGEEEAMATDHSLLDDRYGVAGVEVPADEKQNEEDASESREDDTSKETSPSQDDPAKMSVEQETFDKTNTNLPEEHQVATKSSTERDLTQLYHPPKMPKNKPSQKNSAQEILDDSQPTTTSSNVSLIEILSQDAPPPQGEAQLPFCKKSIELNPCVPSTCDVTGIQDLIGHLTAEKVTPQIKKLSPTPKSEEPPKPMTRKKLVKTRPVLSKRSAKSGQKASQEKPNHFEFLHPVSANVGGRIPTSSTSDDDGSIFLGFDNKAENRSKTPMRSNRVRQMKINETDISDDATPDYDETEEEQQSTKKQTPEKNSEVNTQFTISKKKVVEAFLDDSDSSSGGPTSPMDFGDNVSVDEDRACEVYPQRDQPNWENLVNGTEHVVSKEKVATEEKNDCLTETADEAVKSSVVCLTIEDPPKIQVETHLDAADEHNDQKSHNFIEEKQLKSVINEHYSTISDSKSRKSRRKSNKANELSVRDTSNEPSTSKDSLTNTRPKRQTRGRSKTPGSLDVSEIKGIIEKGTNFEKAAEEVHEEVKDAEYDNLPLKTAENTILGENEEEEKITEEPGSSAKLRGKRKSRSLTKVIPGTQLDVVENPKLKSESIGSKDPEEEIKAAEALPLTTTENKNSVEKLEEKKSVEEPVTSLKSKRNRKTRCASPKIKVPPVVQDEVEVTSENAVYMKDEEAIKAVYEPFVNTENEEIKVPGEEGKRQSRCSRNKSVSITPAASEPEKVINPVIPTLNEDSKEDNASENATEATKSKGKRISRSKTPKILVSQEKGEEVNSSDGPNQTTSTVKTMNTRQSRSNTAKVIVPAVTLIEQTPNPEINSEESEINPETVKEENQPNEPTKPKRSRGKRQSRCTSKSSSKAPLDTKPEMPSITSEEPQPVEVDSVVARVKRKTPSRLGSVPPDSTPKDKEPAPITSRRSNAISVPADVSTPKSRKRRPTNFSEMISPKPEEPKVPAKRGRKRAAPVETEADSAKKLKTEESSETVSIVDFNLRLLLIRKREQLDTEEDVTENGKGEGPLQCGLCMMRCDKKNWHSHLGEHYGVGWTVGNTPKKITRASVMKMMKNHLQNSAEKLTCRLCNHQLGTPLGMLLHLEGCGNKQRIACDFCNRCYTKLSLPGHIRTCPKRQVHQNEDDQEPADGVVAETVYSNAGRAKRKSTIKAETKLKKIGEELTSQKATEETTAKHDFDGDSSDYDMAKDNESSEEYDSEGADSNEDALSTEDEDSLADNKRNEQGHVNRKRKTKRAVNTGECQQKPLLSRYHHLEARATHKWKEFVQRNYKAGSLFSQFLPSYSKVSAEEASFLLPSKETTSIRYAYGKVSKEDDWKQLAPLEGFNKKGEYVGYLGRPIKQLAWVPLPPKITDQYLLCNLRPKMKTFARHTQLKDEEALLMLLKCTVLSDNSDDKSWGLRPELHYGIRVPNGPVHSFSFLPSGGYDKSSNRLGLLAVGSSLSDVHIYALPLELTEEESAGDKVIIQLESLITLSLDVNNPVRDQCTKVCWSQASGHTFLATGYGNGNIAFWDIGDTDNINCFKRNNQTYFVPLTYFYIGERNVQFMDIHYDKNGPRWLAVGTSIRQFMIYDIANWSQPVVLTQDTICTLYMANMTWSPICETLVVSSSHFNRTIAVSPSGIQFEHRTLDGTLTTTREMHTNCQQNHMVFVTDNGDLVFLDVRDLNCGPALLKSVTNRRVVSTTELHHLGANAPKAKDPINADEFLRDYGVQINPLVPAPHRKKSFYLDAKRRPQNVHTLALSRFNCVRCNWNSPAHTWVAMGAEHGLLRILNFDRDKFF
ncbi:microtubule-associated protein futsch isoform X2 [Drosophila gunungcola]|uniref:microtubule-associated protein futsch isoform X2 n=1 Tax=Drosophila gunungcola TaxID=103775 RepID=UPI0022E56F4A|nr:microtubule-associated protein futsch isoform X2 [Drosophila gunungcola]